MKKINQLILRKCKSLSRQLGRSSSYSSLRSKSTRDRFWCVGMQDEEHNDDEPHETVFVGSARKRYVISSKHLNHPLLSALIAKSSASKPEKPGDGHGIQVKCEVVLFDHLLWMLDNADPCLMNSESLEELAELYVF